MGDSLGRPVGMITEEVELGLSEGISDGSDIGVSEGGFELVELGLADDVFVMEGA